MLCLLYVAFDDIDHKVGIGYISGYIVFYDFGLVGGVENLFFHHTLADSGHLRAIVGVDDGCHDIAPKSGTNLVKEFLVGLTCLSVFVRTYLESRTVGSEPRKERRRHTRSEVATDDGSSHKAHLRLLLFE